MDETVADVERARALLDFWFGAPGDPHCDRRRPIWFKATPEFDALCERFAADQRRAAAGDYDAWIAAPLPCLALILLLDQLPRNLHRGSAAAYASDAKARWAAREALARGHDQALPPVRRLFVYLPFEHSEDLADQRLSLELYARIPPETPDHDPLRAARRHHEIIARFGRFPHRNQALGRITTAEEAEFLKEPDSSF
jgi:uncharacterized protein (DUF924 family)